ncbi:winged helix DNA-binding domain-containing protein [Actinobacteria bacterium YIM 96077]|uniref:Winged helix DNA-binding domain-containing protein n=2 Tax=Phytoactinopolyspora halophila TaxID=1981511 RepID=A0A329QT80_9ACTN|nr:winged helix DNA-binding domain-containing protein [Actinobacteria bacterium YIM 96077]RAW15487.1 winged helix DNA-binding domain-containing protein [Phytoactinopolyspora halophila]
MRVSSQQRRDRLMRRHCLAPESTAPSPQASASSIVALHATDPATVYLSVLARCPEASLADVSSALYEDVTLVKMIGMRRTMFVVPTEFAPIMHSAAGVEIAARLRRRLVKQLSTTPTDPPLGTDIESWLADVEDGAEKALLARGPAFASELSEDEPRLRTALLPTTNKAWDVKQNITSHVLTLLGAEGRLVRGRPGGSWVSRMHRWVPSRQIWPEGMPHVDQDVARTRLAQAWLRAFGPASVDDLRWWTGWSQGTVRRVVAELDVIDVELDGLDGIMLADDTEPEEPLAPAAALLPALDSTPMGWKHRDFFLGNHGQQLFDRNGNIGPTVWWHGRIVGGWGMRGPEIVWRLLEDVGVEGETAVTSAAERLQERLEGTPVTPTFRTPLERDLSA